MEVGINMEKEINKKQLHHLLKGKNIELVPVTEEYLCGDKWVDQLYFSILEGEYHKNYVLDRRASW